MSNRQSTQRCLICQSHHPIEVDASVLTDYFVCTWLSPTFAERQHYYAIRHSF
jgi:hypothetical protein